MSNDERINPPFGRDYFFVVTDLDFENYFFGDSFIQ